MAVYYGGCGFEVLDLCLLAYAGHNLRCNLGANLPVVVVLLSAWDELATTFNNSCPTGVDLIKQKRDRIKLDGNSTETLFVFCSF